MHEKCRNMQNQINNRKAIVIKYFVIKNDKKKTYNGSSGNEDNSPQTLR